MQTKPFFRDGLATLDTKDKSTLRTSVILVILEAIVQHEKIAKAELVDLITDIDRIITANFWENAYGLNIYIKDIYEKCKKILGLKHN